MKIIEVALSDTSSWLLLCLRNGHSIVPSIVLANGLDKIAVVGFDDAGKVSSAGHDVKVWVLAVSVWRVSALVGGDLHETVAVSSRGVCVARAFLESKRGKHDGRDVIDTSPLCEE